MYTGPPVAQQGVMGVSGIAAVSTVEEVKSSAAAEQIRDCAAAVGAVLPNTGAGSQLLAAVAGLGLIVLGLVLVAGLGLIVLGLVLVACSERGRRLATRTVRVLLLTGGGLVVTALAVLAATTTRELGGWDTLALVVAAFTLAYLTLALRNLTPVVSTLRQMHPAEPRHVT